MKAHSTMAYQSRERYGAIAGSELRDWLHALPAGLHSKQR
jgi:hypothetical protein